MLVVEGGFKVNDCFFNLCSMIINIFNDLKYGVKLTAVEKIYELLLVCISSTGWKITDSVNSQLAPSMGSKRNISNSGTLKLDQEEKFYSKLFIYLQFTSSYGIFQLS